MKKKTLNHGLTLQLYYNLILLLFSSSLIMSFVSNICETAAQKFIQTIGYLDIDFILISLHEIQLNVDLLHEPECCCLLL